MRFERHASRVAFDQSIPGYVATWSKCGLPDARRITGRPDPSRWIPSIAAMATLYDRGAVPQDRIVCAGRAVAMAWNAGDREMLDSESAKGAAEMVRGIALSSGPGEMDMMQAMRTLADEIAAVRLMDAPRESLCDGAVMRALEMACAECMSVPGFASWPAQSMRRRFIFCLRKRHRTDFAYTLASVLFGAGACPLLPLRDRVSLARAAAEACAGGVGGEGSGECGGEAMSAQSMASRLRFAAERILEIKDMGLPGTGVSSAPIGMDCADSPEQTGKGMP